MVGSVNNTKSFTFGESLQKGQEEKPQEFGGCHRTPSEKGGSRSSSSPIQREITGTRDRSAGLRSVILLESPYGRPGQMLQLEAINQGAQVGATPPDAQIDAFMSAIIKKR